jgi:hypothetical protein
MTILKDVLAELFGMFVADIRLTGAILAVVAVAAGLIDVVDVRPLIGGGILLAGCLGVMIVAILSTARAKR